MTLLILEEEGCARDDNLRVHGTLPRTSKASDFLTSLPTIKLTCVRLDSKLSSPEGLT